MEIGLPKEIKPGEARVALTPGGVRRLVEDGHTVRVEHGAGAGSGHGDEAYLKAGAILTGAEDVWSSSELIVKVKEPLQSEFEFLRNGLILFTYLHLAAEPRLAEALIHAGTAAIGYETVQTDEGGLPLLEPMSEIAGRAAVQMGAWALAAPNGGRGVLMGGSPGVGPAKVVVFGGGTAGTNAARMALGLGSDVTVFELAHRRIRHLDESLPNARVLAANPDDMLEAAAGADLVIGAVLVPGEKAPYLISASHLEDFGRGTVLVDISIDQGGCFETSRPTTHEDPTYEVDGVVHYCVSNIPGAYPATSTRALTNATFPYVLALARLGLDAACDRLPELSRGVNTRDGQLVHPAVARSLAGVSG